MSSSNVIKPGEKGKVLSFSFQQLRQDSIETNTCQGEGDFIPLQDPCAQQPPPVETPVDAQSVADGGDAKVVQAITEDDLDRRLLEAFERGVQEGRRHTEKGLANVFKSLRDAAHNVTALWDKIVRESEADLIQLALMVARKVIQQEISQDRRILANLVASAVNSTTEDENIVVHLNPEDFRVLNGNRQLYLAGVSDEKSLTLKSDESVPQGGCLVETAVGAIDARIDAQLEEIYKRLLEERPAMKETPRPMSAEVDQYVRPES